MEVPFVFPTPKVKVEEVSNVIDLDDNRTSEDIVYEWDAKVRVKLKHYFIADTERNLDTLMKWYIQSLNEDAINFEDFETLKTLAVKHIQFFKLYFVEISCCFIDNYLDNMEEILTFYCNMEARSLLQKRKDINKKRAYKKLMVTICRKIICMLGLYLLNREDRMYHVVMKMKLNVLSEDIKDLLNLLYGKLLTKAPKNKSDLAFCRAYILYQKWKKIRKPEDREKMDEVMYNMYGRTPESVRTNETLRQILLPQNNSVLDVLTHISENHIIISEEYFKFIKSGHIQEDIVLPDMENIELDDEIMPNLVEDNEDEEFDRAYNDYVKTMSNISRARDDSVSLSDESLTVKIEDDGDDDCQIVAVTTFGVDPESSELVHEIVEDEHIDEIIYFKKKGPRENTEENKMCSTATSEKSFLDSIQIPEPGQKVSSSSTNSTRTSQKYKKNMVTTSSNTLHFDSLASSTYKPSSKLQNSVEENFSADITSSTSFQKKISKGASVNSIRQGVANVIIDRHESSTPKSLMDMETSTEDLTAVPKNKTFTNMETQTYKNMETQTDNYDHIGDGDQEQNYRRYYVLETPPSDQPSEDHDVRSTGTSIIYADFVRPLGSPNETDGGTKVLQNAYLPCLVEDFNLDNKAKKSSQSSQINFLADAEPSTIDQRNETSNTKCDIQNDDSDIDFDEVYHPATEPNEKKKMRNLNLSSRDTVCSSDYDSLNKSHIIDQVKNKNGFRYNENSDSYGARHNPDSNIAEENFAIKEDTSRKLPNVSPLSDISCTFSRTPSPKCNILGKSPVPSPNVTCTSTDLIDTSQNCHILSSNPSKPNNETCLSPDITSTSVDIQDNVTLNSPLGDDNVNENQATCENLRDTTLEVKDVYLNNEIYCTEYLDYSKCNGNSIGNSEYVSQSNLEEGESAEEIFVEDPVLMNNEETLPFIIEESLAVGANVNISTDNHCEELSSHSGLSSTSTTNNNYEKNDEFIEAATVSEMGNFNNDKHSSSLRELRVTVENIDVSTNATNLKKNTFPSSKKITKASLNDFSKFEETMHSQWDILKGVHDVGETLSGPIIKGTKMNGNKEPVAQTSTNSSSDVTSPPYEGIDDFRTYFEENKNNSTLDIASLEGKVVLAAEKIKSPVSLEKNGSLKENPVAAQIFPKNIESLTKTKAKSNTSISSTPIDTVDRSHILQKGQNINVKRKRIAFAENVIDTVNSVTHSPTENPNSVLQGILKKSPSKVDDSNIPRNNKRITRPRIPKRMMNLKSLAQFNVKPSDPCIQGVPCVIIERLSDGEISQWLRVSEISRRVRLQKQQAQFSLSHSMLRVDYDKQTSHINENDVVRYNTPEGITTLSVPQTLGHWRSSDVFHSNSNRPEEGMVASTPNCNLIDNDYNSIPLQCENTCCSSLTTDLTNLNVSRVSSELILNLSCCNSSSSLTCRSSSHPPKSNPFLLKAAGTTNKTVHSQESINFRKKIESYSNITNFVKTSDIKRDTNVMSNINFDLTECNFNNEISVSLNQQPAAVPELEEFEKTMKMEQISKASSVSSDVYNLNLRKFSSSPVMTSPQLDSPSQSFLPDLNTSENVALIREAESGVKARTGYDIASLMNSSETSCGGHLNIDVTNASNTIEQDLSEYTLNLSRSNNNNIISIMPLDSPDGADCIKTEEGMAEFREYREDTTMEMLNKTDMTVLETGGETRLPLKKRKHSVASAREEIDEDDDFIDPDLFEDIIKRARSEKVEKEDISYPAKPMISIAEIQEKLHEPPPRVFKTPAERKEMPPSTSQSYINSLETPRIVTEQYNNHTYNNPTINYHMNNVPYPFFPCASLPYFPSILLPLNSRTTFDVNVVTPQQRSRQLQTITTEDLTNRLKKERKPRGGRKKN